MAYDEFIGDRIRQIFKEKQVDFFTKNMFGGLVFMVDNKMCCGIHFDKKKDTDLLMARIGAEATEDALKRDGCHPMDFTGRPMKGYVFVTPDGFDLDEDLEYYITLAIAFNPFAPISKKRKPK